jgi:hypothetical protein
MESLREARFQAREGEDAMLRMELLCELGEVCRERGDSDRTRKVLREALTGFTAIGALHQARMVASQLESL